MDSVGCSRPKSEITWVNIIASRCRLSPSWAMFTYHLTEEVPILKVRAASAFDIPRCMASTIFLKATK